MAGCKKNAGGAGALRKLAAKQAAEAPPAGEVAKAPRPVLSSDGVLDRVWAFVRNTLDSAALAKALKGDKAVLVAAFEDAFIEQCNREKNWFASADIAGGTIVDPQSGEEVELRTGDVQWQEQIRTHDVECCGADEKLLSPEALALMPEYTDLELKKEVAESPANLEALVAAVGVATIDRFFNVTLKRKALTSDQVRELWFKSASDRKTVKSMIAAGAVELVGFAKVMRDPRTA